MPLNNAIVCINLYSFMHHATFWLYFTNSIISQPAMENNGIISARNQMCVRIELLISNYNYSDYLSRCSIIDAEFSRFDLLII